MKKCLLFLMFILLVYNNSNAQEYCGANYTAYSVKMRAYCRYCNKSSESAIFPRKIKFSSTLVCSTLNNPADTSSEGNCKLNSIMLHLSNIYYLYLMNTLAFYSEKCLGEDNPKNVHDAYIGQPEDYGLKDYSFEESEVSTWYDLIESSKSIIGYDRYNQCRAQAATYSITCIKNSCE